MFVHFMVSAGSVGCPLGCASVADVLVSLLQFQEGGIQIVVDVLCGAPDGENIPRDNTAILVIGVQSLGHDVAAAGISGLIELPAKRVIAQVALQENDSCGKIF